MDLVALEWSGTGGYRPDRGHPVGIRRTPSSVRRATEPHPGSAADLLEGIEIIFTLDRREFGVLRLASRKKLRMIP